MRASPAFTTAPARSPAAAAGYRYDLSVLQAQFSRTQILDNPSPAGWFFGQLIRDNLDLRLTRTAVMVVR